ncbi:MAG: hypothetical protein OEV42_11995 [Deltaproteobacteria bacterium]|nr:hypothetical protein [Deltaproteobacteria bacterium]
MRNKNYLLFVFFLFIPVFFTSCKKAEEKPAPAVKKPEKPFPPITEERLSLWIDVAGDIGAYIRKVSLREEEVYEKRTLVMIAHSSARTELEYSNIFKKRGMTAREFWNIVDEMDKVRKYLDIKKEELEQAKELDRLINSGIDEVKALQKTLENEKSLERKKSIAKTVRAMKEKISEFRSYKANISPEAVKIDPFLLNLWKNYKQKYETALAAMWKRTSAGPVRKSYEHR